MNRDYCHCVGANYFRERNPELCESCKRFIPFDEPTEETTTWTAPQYDEKTGTCPLHDPKTKQDGHID